MQPNVVKRVKKLTDWYVQSKGIRADFLAREVLAAAGGDVIVDTFWKSCDDETRYADVESGITVRIRFSVPTLGFQG
jgi:hypothetical protein